MANNRDEFKTQVPNIIKAVVDIADHRQILSDELAESINFRKDVKSATITATGSANTIDFSSNDLVSIDGATNNLDLILTISNTEDGEDSKYIRVLKDVGKTVTFSGSTDITTNTLLINNLSSVVYQVFNKNGTIYVNALVDNNQDTTLIPKIVQIGTWDMDTTVAVEVTHGLPSGALIRDVSVTIQDDTQTYDDPIDRINAITGLTEGGTSNWRGTISNPGTVIGISRTTGGYFDSTNFNSTGINRGWVTIWYTIE